VIIRRRKSFFKLVDQIRAVERDRDDLRAVRRINRLVIAEISRAEVSIQRYREAHRELTRELKNSRPDRATSKAIRARIRRATERIVEQEDQIFIWKCFGDALAFVYLDKFSIKHAYFEIDQLGVKRDAGQISGKDGLKMEIACLEAALQHNVPAVLCDITNVLRYGDVCLLGGSDPYLVEVKSSPRLSARGRRQTEKIGRLHSFLETDKAETFRGTFGTTVRATLGVPERTNVDALNACIADAQVKGHAVASPEAGLSYIAIYDGVGIDEAFNKLTTRPANVFVLNGDKNDHAWCPFVPFVLTIRDSHRLLDFIEGRLSLIVTIDPEPMCRSMSGDGWTVRYSPTGDYALHCFYPEEPAYVAVSRQFLFRAAYEFTSLSWIGEVHRPSLENMEEYARQSGYEVIEVSVAEKTAAYLERLRYALGEGHPWIEEMSPT